MYTQSEIDQFTYMLLSTDDNDLIMARDIIINNYHKFTTVQFFTFYYITRSTHSGVSMLDEPFKLFINTSRYHYILQQKLEGIYNTGEGRPNLSNIEFEYVINFYNYIQQLLNS